jgi:hypothetical protein
MPVPVPVPCPTVRKSPSAVFWLVGRGLWRVPSTRVPRAAARGRMQPSARRAGESSCNSITSAWTSTSWRWLSGSREWSHRQAHQARQATLLHRGTERPRPERSRQQALGSSVSSARPAGRGARGLSPRHEPRPTKRAGPTTRHGRRARYGHGRAINSGTPHQSANEARVGSTALAGAASLTCRRSRRCGRGVGCGGESGL